MSHYITEKMEKIREKELTIKFTNKFYEISDEELLNAFCTIVAFNQEELKNGNEHDKAFIKVKIDANIPYTEYLNIFKVIRSPILYDFADFFLTWKQVFLEQSKETKINKEDYLNYMDIVSNEIKIIMLFTIKTEIEQVNITKNIIKKSITWDNSYKKLFELIRAK